ncbi:unnamed protein product [Heligmosomoides polygyrus]|uniref:Secreted protein n=1 Tax=Heligmosomoides polygyrus TaxID=6339 RepID=A0A183GIK4_HELPZ|nr:unnamed protein product [Heligmosomoides polygyrus]
MPLTLMELDLVTSVARYSVFFLRVQSEPKSLQAITPGLLLSFAFVFACEHYVISIKQRPRDRLLKISCDGIHYDNKE